MEPLAPAAVTRSVALLPLQVPGRSEVWPSSVLPLPGSPGWSEILYAHLALVASPTLQDDGATAATCGRCTPAPAAPTQGRRWNILHKNILFAYRLDFKAARA